MTIAIQIKLKFKFKGMITMDFNRNYVLHNIIPNIVVGFITVIQIKNYYYAIEKICKVIVHLDPPLSPTTLYFNFKPCY
jgi:hypothetical protein